MIEKVKKLEERDLKDSRGEKHKPTNSISREGAIRNLTRGHQARVRFVESHLDKSLAFQIRSLRDRAKWTQAEFAEKLGIKHQNNVSARLENPYYGKHTLTTLKKIAAACDVGLVVWFVPFSRLADWVSGTPHVDVGLSPDFYDVPAFDKDPGLTESSAHVATEAKKEPGSIPDSHDRIAHAYSQLRLVPSGTGISRATAV